MLLVFITIAVLLGALIHHIIAVKIKGDALKAADHLHYAPVLSIFYRWAEKKYLDPYEVGLKIINLVTRLFWSIDRAIDWVYNSFFVGLACVFSKLIRRMHAGYYVIYASWSLLGAVIIMFLVFKNSH